MNAIVPDGDTIEIKDGMNRWGVEGGLLSVMILSIPERAKMLGDLLLELKRLGAMEHFEILINLDNRTKKIGQKRQECIDAATGKYLAFLDDDDGISPAYVNAIIQEAMLPEVDVITFDQIARIGNAPPCLVNASLANPTNEPTGHGIIFVKRRPWHWCAWRAALAKATPVPKTNWGEDWEWCFQMLKTAKTERHINSVLHFYYYDVKVSRSGQ